MKRSGRLLLLCVMIPLASSSCYTWRASDISPRRAITENRYNLVRLTLVDSLQLVVRRPQLVDSLIVWTDESRLVPWAGVPLAHVARVELSRIDAGRTWGLFLVIAPVAWYLSLLLFYGGPGT